jgi:hypothetical protein
MAMEPYDNEVEVKVRLVWLEYSNDHTLDGPGLGVSTFLNHRMLDREVYNYHGDGIAEAYYFEDEKRGQP